MQQVCCTRSSHPYGLDNAPYKVALCISDWYCFEPSPIRFGKITFPGHEEGVTDFQSGDEAVYECDPGFVLSGPAVRHCMSDGEWEGDDSRYVSCVRKCIQNHVYNVTSLKTTVF